MILSRNTQKPDHHAQKNQILSFLRGFTRASLALVTRLTPAACHIERLYAARRAAGFVRRRRRGKRPPTDKAPRPWITWRTLCVCPVTHRRHSHVAAMHLKQMKAFNIERLEL
jgi:hypothetical protein